MHVDPTMQQSDLLAHFIVVLFRRATAENNLTVCYNYSISASDLVFYRSHINPDLVFYRSHINPPPPPDMSLALCPFYFPEQLSHAANEFSTSAVHLKKNLLWQNLKLLAIILIVIILIMAAVIIGKRCAKSHTGYYPPAHASFAIQKFIFVSLISLSSDCSCVADNSKKMNAQVISFAGTLLV